jgi:hypothetical protein
MVTLGRLAISLASEEAALRVMTLTAYLLSVVRAYYVSDDASEQW